MNLTPGTYDDFVAFFARHNGRLQIPLETAAIALRDWNVWRFEDGASKAVFLVKDGYGHVAAYGKARVGIKNMKKAMRWLDIYRTTVDKDFSGGHALAKRLGFKVDHTEGRVTHYALSYN
jgi:hypothetical protein